jgi:exopolyphosphatase/guanosine-5'-triphosphate,3'-diphosphate pyrophosphatase
VNSTTAAAGSPSIESTENKVAQIEGSRSTKRSRRRRYRRKKKKNPAAITDSLGNSSNPVNAEGLAKNSSSGNSGSQCMSHRHRRQPVQQEHPVSYIAKDKARPRKPRHQKLPNPAIVNKSGHTFYAALDLGTNNCRLLVAVPQGGGRFRVVDAFSRIVRLGEGMGSSGMLGEAAMQRTIEALKACSKKLQVRSKTRQRLIATEACRRAGNGPQFLARVLEETGLDLEIVNRETEAQLAVSGCGSLVDRNADGVVLFDIGGGSSELALLDTSKRRSRRLSDHIASWASLPLGVVTLSEKFGGGKEVTPAIFENMVLEVTARLEKFEGRNALSRAHRSGRFHLLGTSGTVTTLAGVHLNLHRYDRRRVDGAWLSDQEVDAMINRILNMSFEDRVNNPCIGADRADLVLAGCAILEAIRRLWPSPRLRVADRGLREGLLTEMMTDDGVWHKRRKKRANRTYQNREQ